MTVTDKANGMTRTLFVPKDGGREAVGDLAWAKDVTLGEGKGVVSFNVVRCAERAKGDGVSRPGVRRERINDKPPYRGRFATNFDRVIHPSTRTDATKRVPPPHL